MPGKGRANIGSTVLLNDSIAYLMTDENEYNKVEGKSLSVLMLDDARFEYRGNVEANLKTGAGMLYTVKALQVDQGEETKEFKEKFALVKKYQKLSECRLVTAEQVPPALEE